MAALLVLVSLISCFTGCAKSAYRKANRPVLTSSPEKTSSSNGGLTYHGIRIPPFNGYACKTVHNNRPLFQGEIRKTPAKGKQKYSPLDSLGRCGPAEAVVGRETMPSEPRGKIGMIKPSGWHTVRYDDLIKDRYLYNRCHLIGYQLSGQNANERNLITGTRYMNVTGMEPLENEVAQYIKDTGNHVRYRVTPMFRGNNLVADGVLMEASDIERQGHDIQFCVFVYNVQPGIEIDYKTGESRRAGPDSRYRVSAFRDKSGVPESYFGRAVRSAA